MPGVTAANESRSVAKQEVSGAGTGVLRPYVNTAVVAGEETTCTRAVLILSLDRAGAPGIEVSVLTDSQVTTKLKCAGATRPSQSIGKTEVI